MLGSTGFSWKSKTPHWPFPAKTKKTLDVGCSHLGSQDCVHAQYNSTNCVQENAEGLGVGVLYTFSDVKMSSIKSLQ